MGKTMFFPIKSLIIIFPFSLQFIAENSKWSNSACKNCTFKVCFPKSLPTIEKIQSIIFVNFRFTIVKISQP